MMLGQLSLLEWFEIYHDRIKVKNIYHTKNEVLFSNVQEIKEVTIFLTQKGTPKPFYIFYDGRKENKNVVGSWQPYNKKKCNLQIYKTPELEDYIKKRFDSMVVLK